jgi:hypothetical protein
VHFCLEKLYLKDNGVLRILRVPPIQISTQNGEMEVLFNKFHRRTNVMPFLGPGTKIDTYSFEILHP